MTALSRSIWVHRALTEIAEQIAALQAQYRKLEEAEQRRALRAFLQGVRQRAETRCLNEIAG